MKKLLTRFFTRHYLRWVTEDDVLLFTKKGILHKGKPLNVEELRELAENAGSIRRTYLWKILSQEIQYAAYQHWLKTGEEMSARMLLRAEEIIRKSLERLEAIPIDAVKE